MSVCHSVKGEPMWPLPIKHSDMGSPSPDLDTRHGTYTPLCYWWLLETRSNLFTWGPIPSHWCWHLVLVTKTHMVGTRSLRRLCFYTCLSFCPRVGVSRSTPRGVSRPTPRECIRACTEGDTPPPRRRVLLRTVRILLECIPVGRCKRCPTEGFYAGPA